MMLKWFYALVVVLTLLAVGTIPLFAQLNQLHGEKSLVTTGVADGNRFRLSIYNDGTLGTKGLTAKMTVFAGEWPINSGHLYLYNGMPFIGTQVTDIDGKKQTIVIHAPGPDPFMVPGSPAEPLVQDWCYLPLPGFYNPEYGKIASSNIPASWPDFWPDKTDDPADPGWSGAWNSYFGKNMFNANVETYYMADDYNYRKYKFYPDSSNLSRAGLGIRMAVRTMQWSAPAVQDMLFTMYEFENISDYFYNKMVIGHLINSLMCQSDGKNFETDSDDECVFDSNEDWFYSYDGNNTGVGGLYPVGYLGVILLESPGNSMDGIDNDNDGAAGSGKVITKEMFAPKTYAVGDPVVLIDYTTMQRQVSAMPDSGLDIHYYDTILHINPGQSVEEIPANLIDDNLNGIIDENNGAAWEYNPDQTIVYQFIGCKYIDYFAGEGLNNPLIEERTSDGIDNDGDWNALTDDVGADGVANSGDWGEGDGIPTVGEPNFENRDNDEVDQIGISSINMFLWDSFSVYFDKSMWEYLTPGFFNNYSIEYDPSIVIGSGYFPMSPGDKQQVWLNLMCSYTLEGLQDSKAIAAEAFKTNFQLPQAPPYPKLTAIAGDNRVTLQWDNAVEQYTDPVLGQDFEGYRLFRTTTANFDKSAPLAQYDLVNEYSGYAALPMDNQQFYLGNNSGLVHEFIDNDVQNGYTYYYALTAYDHGSVEQQIPPMECPVSLVVNADGSVMNGVNVAECMPRDPAYPESDLARHVQGRATGAIHTMIVDADDIKENHTYRVTFKDSVFRYGDIQTKNFTLTDISKGSILLKDQPLTNDSTLLPLAYYADGFRITFDNPATFCVDKSTSGWNSDSIYDYNLQIFRYSSVHGYPEPAEYHIEFGEIGLDTSIVYKAKVKTFKSQPVNFRVKNLTTDKYIHVGFWAQDKKNDTQEDYFTAFTDGTLSDRILFFDDTLGVSWMFELTRDVIDSSRRNPRPGDVIELHLQVPFTGEDVFEMTMPQDFNRISDDDNALPKAFALRQNYPNPFNPVTTIEFALPQRAVVNLEIFNVLGQRVKLFKRAITEAGNYEFTWDGVADTGAPVAGGVYIYRITAQSNEYTFTAVKKMVLLK